APRRTHPRSGSGANRPPPKYWSLIASLNDRPALSRTPARDQSIGWPIMADNSCTSRSETCPVTGSLRSRSNLMIAAWVSAPTVPVAFNWPKPYSVSARCTAATRCEPVICMVGIGAGGRSAFAGGATVAFTRLPSGSLPLLSERRSSFAFSVIRGSIECVSCGSIECVSAGAASASAGRGRGRATLARLACCMCTTEPNIGAGCGPVCRKTALVMIALTAANAIRPATISFGLYSRMRSASPRCVSASGSIAAAAPRRRRGGGASSSSATAAFLGTFLHLGGLVLNCLVLKCRTRRKRQRRDLASGLRRLRPGENQRQRHGYGGALVELALYRHFAGMEADQAFHDGKPKPGALMAALVSLAGLEEGIADPLEIVGRDTDAGIADAHHEVRSFDARSSGNLAPALGEFDRIGDKVDHDLLEGARIAGDQRQILRCIGNEVDAALPCLQCQQIAAIDQRHTRRERLRRNLEIAGFHLRHVEDAVDDRQQ